MKTLYLIRHAKSSWDDLSIDDFDRPLNKKGKSNIRLIAKRLKEKNIFPDIIISSPAKRTKKTSEKICKILWYEKKKIIYDKWIYDNLMNWNDFLVSIIKGIDRKCKHVFLVWHNPSLNEFASYLLWEDTWNIPTSWILAIKFDSIIWRTITNTKWKKDFFIYPKMQ